MSAHESPIIKGAFGAKNRARLITEYFRARVEGGELLDGFRAWHHVYRLLLWVDQTTGLAHCYESDKCQPGKGWYGRSLAFHAWTASALGVPPRELAAHVDWLFRQATTDLAKEVLQNAAKRLVAAERQRSAFAGRDEEHMKPELLATLRAAGRAATPGPWHRGQRIISAGIEPRGMEGTGKCALCHPSRPLHSVVPRGYHSEYGGKISDLHRHIDPEPHRVDHVIQSEDGELVAGNYDYEDGGIVNPVDAAFIAHARNHWDALLDEIERLKAALRRYGSHDSYESGRVCPKYEDNGGPAGEGPCTCGYSAALNEVLK